MFMPSTPLLILVIYMLQYINLASGQIQLPFQVQDAEHIHKPLLDDEFDSWLAEAGYEWGMKGVSIAVTRKNSNNNGWTTETKGYGVADRWGNPVDDETLFAIGSNSKLFTALGVGLLTVNESMPVDWDTKVKDILPKSLWVLQDSIAQEHASLVDILTHRTGLPRHELSYSLSDTTEDVVAKLRYLRPSAEFREIWQYNNQMYMAAAHIISQFTNTSFATYITRQIISPLDMNHTTYNLTEAETFGRVAEGFLITGKDEEKGEGKQKIRSKPVPFWSEKSTTDVDHGPGGVISNAKDLAIWLQALLLLGKSPATGDEVIPKSIVERVARGMTVQASQANGPGLSPVVYGMGQGRYSYQGHEIVEHSGSVTGHYSIVARAPHDGFGIAVLINSDSGITLMNLIKWRLLEKSLGLPKMDWEEWYRKQERQTEKDKLVAEESFSSNGTPSMLPYDDLAGIYYNPAYGTLILCPYPPSSNNRTSREECKGIVSEALRPTLNETRPALLAAWSKPWATHVLLHHVSGDRFKISIATTFPAPFPDLPENDDDSRAFAVVASLGSLRFSFAKQPWQGVTRVEGFGCTGVWGAEPGVKELDGDGRDGAEVWFDRVV